MKWLKIVRCIFFVAVCLHVAEARAQDTITQYLVVHPSSSITINGRTNVNAYCCAVEHYAGSDTLLLTAYRGKGAYFQKGIVKLNASLFDCGMKAITKDFRESIQSEKYPHIILDFISFERIPQYKATAEEFNGKLTVKLANVAVPCEVRCSIVKDKNNQIHLRGKRNFKFSDFHLKPPQKMMCMIKVEEQILIDFHLVLSMKRVVKR